MKSNEIIEKQDSESKVEKGMTEEKQYLIQKPYGKILKGDSKTQQRTTRIGVKQGKLEKTKKFLYNDGYICSRKPMSWVFSILYLIFLWTFVGSTLYGGITLLRYTLRDVPKFFGHGSFIGGTPQLIFKPFLKERRWKNDLINYTIGQSSMIKYVNDIRNVMEDYKRKRNTHGYVYENCLEKLIFRVSGDRTTESCDLDVENADEFNGFGPCRLTNETNFGYDKGSPCILLRLNKIIGYYPESLKDTSEIMKLLDNGSSSNFSRMNSINITIHDNKTGNIFCMDERMFFHCKLKNQGNEFVKLYPSNGYSYCYYPFWNQRSYLQPFIMLKLFRLQEGKKVTVECEPSAADLSNQVLTLHIEYYGSTI